MIIDVYSEEEGGEGKREKLATFTVTGIEDVAINDVALKEGSSKPKVSLSFELTRSGLIQLNKAEAKVEELVYVEDKPSKTKKSKSSSSSSSAASDEEPAEKEK
jgi:hypothetical protein